METNNTKSYIIDPDTGEITDELKSGDRIVRGASLEHLRTTTEVKTKSFVRINTEELQGVLPELSNSERSAFTSLLPYISYKTCCLQSNAGDDINLKDIIEISGMSEITCAKAIDGLIKKDILYKGRNSKSNQYFVNPWIANKGQTVNKVLKQMFKNYRVHSLGGKRWGNIPD